MTEKAHILQVERLTIATGKDQGEVRLVNRISFCLSEGEITVLAGPTGAGKTLTARAILALIHNTSLEVSGKILYHQNDCLSMSPEDMNRLRGREIAYMPQDALAGFNPVIRIGKQILETVLLDRSIGKIEGKKHVLSLIEEVGLAPPERFYDAFPSQVSGGELQRLMWVMSIARNPKLLVLDEPTSALDPASKQQLLQLIRDRVQSQGTTVLIITHDIRHLAPLADTLMIMERGVIVDNGTISYLKQHAKSNITQELFEAMHLPTNSPQNAMEGEPARPSTPVLSVKHLQVGHYDEKGKLIIIINNFSFKLYAGQCLGISGPSGAGKSTLALGIARLADFVGGQVFLEGKDILKMEGKGLRMHRKKIQMIWQNPASALHPKHTIRQIFLEALALQPKEGARMDLESLLRMTQLPEELLMRRPHQLSGGQQQRVCIAAALALKPKVLICDEPVSALDTVTQLHILKLLQSLQHELGLALIFISHDEDTVRFMTANVMNIKSEGGDGL